MTHEVALQELHDAGLTRPAADESFDRFARLVHRFLAAPIATVTVAVDHKHLFLGAFGVPPELEERREAEKDGSLCETVIQTGEPLIVEDLRAAAWDGRPPIADGPPVAAYAGFPITSHDGLTVGALCAMDTRPRRWSTDELATLEDLAAACTSELRLRLARDRAQHLQELAIQANRRTRLLLDLSESFAGARDVPEVVEGLTQVSRRIGAAWVGLAPIDPGGRTLTYTTTDLMEPSFALELRQARLDDDRPTSLVARTRRPLFFSTSEDLIGQFPHLAGVFEMDVGARAFLPVINEDELLAVMMLGWSNERHFDAEAVKTEMAIASYVAHALDRIGLLEERHKTATTLQTAMLSDLPAIERLEMAVIYSPATSTDQVGGDWYDAVTVDEDSTVLMVGDVTGHDMHAAAQMGQLRSMLRTFAWSMHEAPSALLRLLDRANDGLGLHATGTAVVARLNRRRDSERGWRYDLTWSNAGHPVPLVLRADGTVDLLDERPDIMLGVVPGAARRDQYEDLAPGDTLVLYTDGLVEHRGDRYADRLATLVEAVGHLAGIATASLPSALVRRMITERQQDDIAVLVARVRHGADPRTSTAGVRRAALAVESTSHSIGPARRWVDDVLESDGVDVDLRRTAMLLTSELVTNAINHARPPISVEVELTAHRARVSVSDGAVEIPRLLYPRPEEIGGRGIQFMQRRASRWGFDVATQEGEPGAGADPGGAPAKTVWFELDR